MEGKWSSSVRDVRSVDPVLAALDGAGHARYAKHHMNDPRAQGPSVVTTILPPSSDMSREQAQVSRHQRARSLGSERGRQRPSRRASGAPTTDIDKRWCDAP